MSDSTASTDTQSTPGKDTPPSGGTPADGSTFAPITSQADFDRAIGQRLAREQSKHDQELARFADYETLKARAAQVDQAEEASKTETQKLADQLSEMQKRLDQSEKDASAARQEALRAQVATDKGVPVALLPRGGTKEQLEAAADELKTWAGAQRQGARMGPGANPPGGSGEHAPKAGGLKAGRELFEASHQASTTN